MNQGELVIYVWEGQADIAERVERCMLSMDVEVVRADGLNMAPASTVGQNAIAVVSVSMLEGARFSRNHVEGTFGGMPVLWVSSNLRGATAGSYIEFPSYRTHGCDPMYPPDEAQRLADRNTEMLHFHQVLCSDLTIVPSAHARSLFPPLLQDRIAVQFEGFDIQPPLRGHAADAAPGRRFTMAFSARDLSSAKGFETYMRLVERMVREGDAQNTRFIAIGDDKAATYGYEQQWVERRYGGKVASFRDHLLKVHPGAEVVEFPGRLPYADFAALLAQVDLFLYPLRHGVANWGLMEILARGGCVIGTNWGFLPELVQNDVNGLLLPDNDDAWIAAIRALRADPARRARYAKAAQETGRQYHISKIAPRFMALFERALGQRRAPLLAGAQGAC